MQIGTVLDDGYIVAGEKGGRFFAVAPASKRVRLPFKLMEVKINNPEVRKPSEPADAGFSGEELTENIKKSQDNTYAGSACEYCVQEGAVLPSLNELKIVRSNLEAIDAADNSGGEYTLALIRDNNAPPELTEEQIAELESGKTLEELGIVMPEYITPYVWTSSNHSPRSQWFITMYEGDDIASFRNMENWVVPIKYLD